MPWVAACFDLLAAPILGYCLAVRKLALQASILAANLPSTSNVSKDNTLNADTMAPSAEEQRQGKSLRE